MIGLFIFYLRSSIMILDRNTRGGQMKMMLAENIRAFRKERSLTQEQLSEALGVTAGAVYKWEAKLSIPDLEMIIQMADFFDTSVDVLLGYEVKDNRHEATVKRLQEYRRSKDWDGLAEAEKALKKYPHSFQIVTESAVLYRAFGFDSGDKALFHRALELLEQSRLLLSQNEDPQISEQTKSGVGAENAFASGKVYTWDLVFINKASGKVLTSSDREHFAFKRYRVWGDDYDGNNVADRGRGIGNFIFAYYWPETPDGPYWVSVDDPYALGTFVYHPRTYEEDMGHEYFTGVSWEAI